MNEQQFQRPMEPWPDLQRYAKNITLKTEQLSLFYFEAGQGNSENIIMIHGLGDEADTWRHVFQPLSEICHAFAIDLPGFGRSDKPDTDYSPQFFISIIHDFVKSQSIEKTFLMGSSLGAILSQEYALQFPDKTRGLVLLDGGLIQREPMLDWSLQLMRVPLLGEWLYTRLRKDPDDAYDSLKNVYQDLDKMPEQDRDFLYQRVNKRVWSDGQRRAYFSTLRNLTRWIRGSQKGLPERLQRFNIPTLVIRGEFDQLFPPENADALIEAQANAKKVVISDAGHLPHQERPQAVIDNVIKWMDKFN